MRTMARLLGCLFLAGGWLLPGQAEARCAPEVVRRDHGARLVAFTAGGEKKARSFSIQWFGHSAFQVTSPGGTRIFTDPFGHGIGLPIPQVNPHAVTIGREHPHHNSVWVLQGSPLVIRGLRDEGMEWAEVRRTVGDVLIYNVPVTQRTFEVRTKGSPSRSCASSSPTSPSPCTTGTMTSACAVSWRAPGKSAGSSRAHWSSAGRISPGRRWSW
ncbi:MAG: MBL fold metallo-hydrolase [Candidatus Tectomicrobia bacterium]|nr:MBL fold metallo-hydrolase [Candidatus Tectomicrobia bacterium]